MFKLFARKLPKVSSYLLRNSHFSQSRVRDRRIIHYVVGRSVHRYFEFPFSIDLRQRLSSNFTGRLWMVGSVRLHWTARLARWAIDFYMREWKWVLGAAATVIGALAGR